jgi:hypothetical protein
MKKHWKIRRIQTNDDNFEHLISLKVEFFP